MTHPSALKLPPTATVPDPRRFDVSVVIPAHNEQRAVGVTVARVRAALSDLGLRFEIVLVDDGSTDGTKVAAEHAGARVLSSPVNGGYGRALKRGIAASESEFIAILDADGTYPPEALAQMLELGKTVDMVVGDRGAAMSNVPLIRRPAKWLLHQLANFLAQRHIPDLNSGLRVFRRESLERFIPLLPDGFSFTTTITLAMLCSKMEVAYLPISYGKRIGRSKIRATDFFSFVLLVLRIIMLFEPLRIFIPFGGMLFALGAGKMIYDFSIRWKLSESAVLFLLAALIVWSLGLIADMIARLHLRP